MPRSAFPIALAIVGILAGRAVMTMDKIIDTKATQATTPAPTLTAGNQRQWGKAQGLPGF
jgi:hypothetical protein